MDSMQTEDLEKHPYPRVEAILDSIAGWVSLYRETLEARHALGTCDRAEVERIAQELRVSPQELVDLSRKPAESAALLGKMLTALGVDGKALADKDPLVMRDLQRLCVSCSHKRHCAQDLEAGGAPQHFHDYCPNAFTLDALIEAQGPKKH